MAVVFAAMACLGFGAIARADVKLLDDGNNPVPIYTAANPSSQEANAAKELARYFEKMTGAKFDVRKLEGAPPERAILIGDADKALSAGLTPDSFRIVAKGQRVSIVGGNAQGVLYGAFALLEEHMGCRWWSHDEEDVPTGKKTLSLPEMDRTVKPLFEMHEPWNREAQSGKDFFNAKARTTSWEDFSGGHSLYPLLTPYAKDHPEIYPQGKDGTRKANDLHFCYLAPNIAEALADALSKQVDERKGNVKDVIYFAGMGDWYGGMCECDACKKVYEEETWTDPDGRKKPGYTGTLLRMINKTAEILEKKYPGIRVGTFAYMSLEAPPSKTKPRDNVVIRIPRLRHCTVHPAETCEKNQSFLRNTQRWCELAPGRTYIWEYGVSFKHYWTPFPCLVSMSENLRLYHRLGIRGVQIQGNYTSTGSDLVVMKNYVWRRLMWEPKGETRAILKEFCDGYYGPASAEMLEYVDALENSVNKPTVIHADEFAGHSWLTADVRKAMAEARDKALAKAAGNETFTRRVKEATVSLDAIELWKPGAFEERDGKLVRKDIGEYTLPKTLDMIKHLRGGGSSEWSSGRSQQMHLIALQGGPVYTIGSSPLQAKVAPLLRGQIRQINWQGKGLLDVADRPNAKGYPFIGGSYVDAGMAFMVADDNDEGNAKPSTRKLRMHGESGVGNWSPETKQKVWLNVEAPDDGSIRIVGEARRVSASDGKRGSRVTTTYEIGKKWDGFAIEVEASPGKWTLIETKDGKEAAIPENAAALRVTLPMQGCVVEDRIMSPRVTGGTITVDHKTGTATTVVNTSEADIPANGTATFISRKITAQALTK